MILIYINDMMEGINSYTNLFADDGEVMMRVKEE